MPLATKLKIVLPFLIFFMACSDSTPSMLGRLTNIESFKILGKKEFTKQKWDESSQEERGKLVYSFLYKNKEKRLSGQDIFNMLGPSTAYYDHDHYPAYFIGPKSIESIYGNGYLLAFLIDDAGYINGIILDPKL